MDRHKRAGWVGVTGRGDQSFVAPVTAAAGSALKKHLPKATRSKD